MRKRILGAAVLFSFIVSLTAASNMKEDVKIKEVPAMEGLAAGSIRFAHSFTPESDEKTGIEKKESMIVTSAYDDDLMQEKIRTTKETQMGTGGAGNSGRAECTNSAGSSGRAGCTNRAGDSGGTGHTGKPLAYHFIAG